MAYEGFIKRKYYIIDKKGTNGNVSIGRVKVANLEGDSNNISFPPAQFNPKITATHYIINSHEETSVISNRQPTSTRSVERLGFAEHLNDDCT